MAVWQKINTNNFSFGLRLDPEFYQPHYRVLRKTLSQLGTKRIFDLKNNITYGLQAEPNYLVEGTRYIRALNLKETGIDGEVLKISKQQIVSENYVLQEGDLLITRSGANCGDVGVIDEEFVGSTFGSYVIRMRLFIVNPFYVYAFLLSKYGRFQTIQIRTGLAQPNLSIPYIENLIEVPELAKGFQTKIESIVKESFLKQRTTLKFYSEAEQELLERLEWKSFNKKHTLSYKTISNTIENNARLDAEFYQPKFITLASFLQKKGAMRLGEFCNKPNRGVQPEYVADGNVLVINSKHLGSTQIDIENTERTSDAFFSDENSFDARLKKFDVLMYSTGAYVGRANVYLENQNALASNHVTIIRPNSEICSPVYLALYLNSEPGLMQTDQRASGSAQREIYSQEIINYHVFLPQNKNGKVDLEWQNKLADKIIKAYEAKKEAKKKLKEAIELVEREIEKMLKDN